MANFSELLDEHIELFMKRLSCIDDCVRASAACKSWQSGAAATRKNPRFTPWLMQANDDDDKDTDAQNCCKFSCLSRKRDFKSELPDIHNRKCWGTPFGWIVSLDFDLNFDLINPISGVQLALPPLSTFPIEYPKDMGRGLLQMVCARRFSLSSNPSNPNESCVVITVYNPGQLCFAKLGDKVWTPIETPRFCYEDAIFFNGLVYAIDARRGFLTVCDINTPHPKGTLIESSPPFDRDTYYNFYLIEFSGELHLVVRYLHFVSDKLEPRNGHYVTSYLSVYKFDFQKTSWTEVVDLGDHALFVGNFSSFAISTNDYPDFRSNAIYHTDDMTENVKTEFCDMGVYDLTKKISEPFYMGTNVPWVVFRPLFIIPSL